MIGWAMAHRLTLLCWPCLTQEGIKHEFMTPHTPQQNGISERLNCKLIGGIHTMLVDSKLLHRFWTEALSTCVYLRNHSPTKVLRWITPHEACNGMKPDVRYFVSLDVLPTFMFPKWRSTSLILRPESVCYWAMELIRRVTIFMTLSIWKSFTVEISFLIKPPCLEFRRSQ